MRKKPSMLASWAVLPLCVFLVAEFYWGYPIAKLKGDPGYAMSYEGGRIIFSIVISLGVAAFFWWMTKSQLVSTILFSVVMLLLCATTYATHIAAQREAADRVMRDAARGFFDASARAEGARKAAVAGNALGNLKGIDASQELERRIRLLDDALGEVKALLAAGDDAPKQIEREFDKVALGQAVQRGALDKWERDAKWRVRRAQVASDERILRAARELLEYLRAERAHWTYNAAAGKVEFDSDAKLAPFNRLANEVDAAIRDDRALNATEAGKPGSAGLK